MDKHGSRARSLDSISITCRAPSDLRSAQDSLLTTSHIFLPSLSSRVRSISTWSFTSHWAPAGILHVDGSLHKRASINPPRSISTVIASVFSIFNLDYHCCNLSLVPSRSNTNYWGCLVRTPPPQDLFDTTRITARRKKKTIQTIRHNQVCGIA